MLACTRTVGPLWPAVLLSLSTLSIVPCAAGPLLETTAALVNGSLTLTVRGTQLPAMKRLSLTFGYDASRLTVADAMVSSPLPSTAFCARLDTAARTLTVQIVATSVVTVPDGAVVTVIHAPAIAADPAGALTLSSALCIDTAGAVVVPQIGSAGVKEPTVTGRAARTRGVAAALTLSVDGRRCHASMRGRGAIMVVSQDVARGVLVIRAGLFDGCHGAK